MTKLSVHLVAWNGARYIPYLFESMRKQTYKDWELLAIDNNSTKDDTADLIEKEFKNFPVSACLVRNKENNGFAGGHNQAMRQTQGEYVQLLNQDMYLAPDYFERVVAMMDVHPEAGAGQGLLLRWDFGTNTHTTVIDTMGLRVFRSRRVVDLNTGCELSTASNAGIAEVFGVSGALPVYRRRAVDDVAFEGNMFDDEFGSYKEDVDLAFRMRAAGWKAYVEPRAHAWHDRTAAGPRESSDRAAMKNRKGRPEYVNRYSYRNHIIVLLKNEHRANFAKDWPAILWYEFKKFLFMLLFDHGVLKGIAEIKRMMPRIARKRQFIMEHYKVKPKEMRKWYV